MAQRILNLNDAQIVSGTETMTPGEHGEHTRMLWVSVPHFATRPDITVSIYSAEGMPNAGTTFAPQFIEYIPEGGADGLDLIAISTINTEACIPISVHDTDVVCSYLAVGEREFCNV